MDSMDMIKRTIYPFIALVIIILIWQLIVSLTGVHPSLLPGPVETAKALSEVASSGILLKHIGASLFRVAVGFFSAAFLAIPLGLLLGTKKYLNMTLGPILQAVRTISPISWIPLAILWFGVGNLPAIFIIFITALFPILLSTALSVQHVDPTLIKVGKNFGLRPSEMLVKIILPAIVPYIVIGLKISLGISWVIIVAAEMVGMSSGLGYMILDARNFLRTDLIIAGMFVIGVIGFTLDKLLSILEVKIKGALGFNN